MFITFEGIDLSGKSTQAGLLFDYLKSKKKKVVLVREPGGTLISEKIRQILLDKNNQQMKYITEFLLFSASRHQLTEEIVKPLLKKKYIVICDRYYDSSTAYQGFGGKIDLKTINHINKVASGNLEPDITFLIDIDYKENIKRREVIKKVHDRIEQKQINYYRKVIKGYRTLAKLHKKRFLIIEGNKSIEDIKKDVVKILIKRKIV